MKQSDPSISFFKNARSTTPTSKLTLPEYINKVREGEWKEMLKTRKKVDLPAVTLSGVFKVRKGRPVTHSSYIGVDLDAKDNKGLVGKRKQLQADPYVCGCWLSASGKGLRLLFKIEPKKHLKYFQEITTYLAHSGFVVDKSGKDEARLTYISYDPHAYLDLTKPLFVAGHVDTPSLQQDADDYEKDNDVIDLPTAKQVAAEVLKNKVDITGSYQSWFQIGQVLAELGEKGRKLYHDISRFHPDYTKAETDEQFSRCLERTKVRVKGQPILSGGTLIHYAKEAGLMQQVEQPKVRISKKKKSTALATTNSLIDLSLVEGRYSNRYVWGLWEFAVKQQKKSSFVACLGIDVEAAAAFLYSQGIRVWDDLYYQVKDNVVTPKAIAEIHELLHQQALALPKDIQIHFGSSNILTRDVILAASHQTLKAVFQKITLKPFDHTTARFVKDTYNTIHLFFKNGVVLVTSKSAKLVEYGKLDAYVWSKWIKDREFKATAKRSVVQRIMDNAVGKKNRDAYMTAIGYMVSTHIQPIGSPILLCSDIEITDMQDGGTGKDFMRQILENVRAVTKIDGKHLDFSNEFAFAKVTNETEIVWIEDLRKGCSMSNFYGMNEGLTVRRLHTQPFEIKCKIGMSLQHSIEMEGNSDTRRQIFLAYGPHYRKVGGIDKELGYMVLQDDFKEWGAFYQFIVECCQLFLKKGVVRMDITPLKEIRKEELGGEGFERLAINKLYTPEEAYKIWAGDDAGFFDKPTQMNFKVSWVKWCRLAGKDLVVTRVGPEKKRMYKMINL